MWGTGGLHEDPGKLADAAACAEEGVSQSYKKAAVVLLILSAEKMIKMRGDKVTVSVAGVYTQLLTVNHQ